MTRILAAMLGCSFDALWQRERRTKTRRAMTALGASAALMAVFLAVVISKNAVISDKNEQITAQNRSLQRHLSSSLVDAGLQKLEHGDREGAVQNGLDSLLDGEEAISFYDPRSEALLADALGAYRYQYPQCSMIYDQRTDIKALAATADGKFGFLSDDRGVVSCVSLDNGGLQWKVRTPNANPVDNYGFRKVIGNNYPGLFLLEDRGILICKNTASISAPRWKRRVSPPMI